MGRWFHFGCCVVYLACASQLHIAAALLPGSRGTGLVLIYLAMSLASFAIWTLEHRARITQTRVVMATAIAVRVLLFTVPAFSSTDISRYMWDGRVALGGWDPYSITPADNRLDHLQEEWPTPPEHQEYPTLYPPVAVALFALCAAFGPISAIWVWRSLILVASLTTVWAIWRLLKDRHQLSHLALVVLSPVLVIEGQVGAHLDILVAACVALGLLALERSKPLVVAAFWGLGAALKILPAAMLAVWLTHRGARRGFVPGVVAAVIYLIPVATVLALGWVPLGSLGVFFRKWRFGSPLWLGLEPTLGSAMPWLALAGALLTGTLLLRIARVSKLNATLLIFAGATPLLWSPVVFPWYLAPLLPLVAASRSTFLLGWATALPLTYEVLDRYDVDGSWEPAAWPIVMLAVVWGATAAYDLRRPPPPHRRQ